MACACVVGRDALSGCVRKHETCLSLWHKQVLQVGLHTSAQPALHVYRKLPYTRAQSSLSTYFATLDYECALACEIIARTVQGERIHTYIHAVRSL